MRVHPASRVRAQAFGLIEFHDTTNVLLVGIGTGADLEFLKTSKPDSSDSIAKQSGRRRPYAGPLVVGIDISPAMLIRAQHKANCLQMPLLPLCANSTSLPLREALFDVVVLTLILSVVPNPQQTLREALRVLRPGGRVLVLDKFLPTDQQPSSIRRAVNLLTRPFGTDINRHWEMLFPAINAIPLMDQSSGPGNFMRTIVLQKPS